MYLGTRASLPFWTVIHLMHVLVIFAICLLIVILDIIINTIACLVNSVSYPLSFTIVPTTLTGICCGGKNGRDEIKRHSMMMAYLTPVIPYSVNHTR